MRTRMVSFPPRHCTRCAIMVRGGLPAHGPAVEQQIGRRRAEK